MKDEEPILVIEPPGIVQWVRPAFFILVGSFMSITLLWGDVEVLGADSPERSRWLLIAVGLLAALSGLRMTPRSKAVVVFSDRLQIPKRLLHKALGWESQLYFQDVVRFDVDPTTDSMTIVFQDDRTVQVPSRAYDVMAIIQRQVATPIPGYQEQCTLTGQ